MNVKIDKLASEIMKGLEDYSKMASDELKSEVKKAAKNIKQDIKDTAPVGRTGRYAKSWTVKNNRAAKRNRLLLTLSRARWQRSTPPAPAVHQAGYTSVVARPRV